MLARARERERERAQRAEAVHFGLERETECESGRVGEGGRQAGAGLAGGASGAAAGAASRRAKWVGQGACAPMALWV